MSYLSTSFDDKIIELLKKGGVGFMPSDTVYGLSALALNEVAVDKIYGLKGRDDNKPCIILLANTDQAGEIGINPDSLKPAESYWPAPLTFIVSAPNAPQYLHRGVQSLAIRIPDNKDLLALISKVGPLVSTSANLQNEPIAHDINISIKYFGNNLDFYIDAGELNGKPSTIVKLDNGGLKILRQGAWQIPL